MKFKFTVIIIVLALIFCILLYYINYQQRDRVVLSSYDNKSELNSETIRVMTYNIHGGVGNDGILDFNRTISTIKNSKAQIIGLNEVDNKMIRSGLNNQVETLAEELDMNYVFGPTLSTIIGSYGNAILTVFPIINAKNHPLPVDFGQEPRGVLEADIILPGGNLLKVLITHLSINKEERLKQQEWLDNYLEKLEVSYILMGDFNSEKINFSGPEGLLQITGETFPAYKPEKRFDMFFTNCRVTEGSYTIKTNTSDHLPLIIELPMGYNNK